MLFISPQKLFSFSRYLSFCLDFLVMYQKGLIKKMVNFKFYDVTPWLKSYFNTHTKFGQLIECNMKTIFLEKSYTKCGGEI